MLISVVSGGVVTASKSIYFLTWMSLLMINFEIPFMNIHYWWCCTWWWCKNQWWLFNLTPQLFTLITIELNLHLRINQLVCMLTIMAFRFWNHDKQIIKFDEILLITLNNLADENFKMILIKSGIKWELIQEMGINFNYRFTKDTIFSLDCDWVLNWNALRMIDILNGSQVIIISMCSIIW